MNYIEEYYTNYDEDGRLLSNHGQVEYRTTMKYIHEVAENIGAKKILEVGAGTGRYSIALAKEGFEVDAVELTDHNLQILNSKLEGMQNIRTYQEMPWIYPCSAMKVLTSLWFLDLCIIYIQKKISCRPL